MPEGSIVVLSGQVAIPSGFNFTLTSSGAGATLDAQRVTRHFSVGSSAFLRLVRISLVNGHAAVAGAVFVGALGAKFTMEHARILACESIYAGGAILADPGAAAAAQAASAGSASVDVVLANVDILDTVSSDGRRRAIRKQRARRDASWERRGLQRDVQQRWRVRWLLRLLRSNRADARRR